MNRKDVIQAWGRVSTGYKPLLSIEITRECPLRCPGCYAYEDAHLGGSVTLRQLIDKRGDELIAGVLSLVDKHRPLHLSLVAATLWFATVNWRSCSPNWSAGVCTPSWSLAPSALCPRAGALC